MQSEAYQQGKVE